MFESRPNLYVGYHGCSKTHGEEFLKRITIANLHQSVEDYEWLGKGFYVWENNYARAIDWRKRDYKKTKKPFVVGVIYSLDECLDLTDSKYLKIVSGAYNSLVKTSKIAKKSLPKNLPIKPDDTILGKRLLDCAVLEYLHKKMDNPNKLKKFEPWYNKKEKSIIKPFDTVRSAFFEGENIYEGASFRDKDHIQICIRNPKCIKGFFRPLDMD